MPSDARVARMVSVASAVLTTVAVVVPPAVFFLMSYERVAGSLDAEAELSSAAITQIIGANPELWMYEQVRLADCLARRPRTSDAERRRVLDLRGAVVAENADPLPTPWITRSLPLLDAGARVGSLEISRSLRPLLVRSGIISLLLLPLSILAFRALRNVPLRAVRRSETELRRQRDAAQRYLDVAGVAFVILDPAGRVSLVNRRGAEILDRTDAEVLGRDWISNFVEPTDRERVAAWMGSGTRPGEVSRLEYGVLRPSGERRILSWYVTPLSDGGAATGLLGSGVDITEQRQLEEQLRHAQKLEAVGQLAGGVAHDFNNILSTIKGYAALLRRELPKDDPHREDVDEILAASDRAASLTRNLLAFSRKQVLQPEPVDLVEVVRRAERFLRRLVREDVELVYSPAGDPLPVMADGLQLEQVLMNFVTNAQDAMPDGGRITLATSRAVLEAEAARQAGLAPGAYALVTVSDTGTGIAPEARAHVFEPFFTTKEVGRGTGLGLAIAYGIVKQHHGIIRLESEPGHGSTFTVLLPLLGAIIAPTPPPETEPPPRGTETLLVAEDDDAVRRMLRQLLEGAGYSVVEAADGAQAVRRYQEHRDRIRLSILDVVMPVQDGRRALDEIRRLDPSARALFLSGHAEEPNGRKAIDVGGELLIAKPADPVELLRTVRTLLDL